MNVISSKRKLRNLEEKEKKRFKPNIARKKKRKTLGKLYKLKKIEGEFVVEKKERKVQSPPLRKAREKINF